MSFCPDFKVHLVTDSGIAKLDFIVNKTVVRVSDPQKAQERYVSIVIMEVVLLKHNKH